MPHITEEIWQTLTQSEVTSTEVTSTEVTERSRSDLTSLARQTYPEPDEGLIDPKLETQFAQLIDVIRTLRNLRAIAEIKPGVQVPILLQTENPTEQEILTQGSSLIQMMAKTEAPKVCASLDEPMKQTIVGVTGTVQVLIPLAGVVDIGALRAKVEKDLGKIEKESQALQKRLGNPGFVNKAPQDVVQGARDALEQLQIQAQILRDRLSNLSD